MPELNDEQLAHALRLLDPARQQPAPRTVSAEDMLAELNQPEATLRADDLASGPAPARLHGRAAALVGAAALVAVAVGTFAVGAHQRHQASSALAVPPLVGNSAFLSCGSSVLVPVTALSAAADAETASTLQAQALRTFLAAGPDAEGDTLPATGWLQLSDTGGDYLFGHREGGGIGRTVQFHQEATGFGAPTLGGCGSVVLANGQVSHNIGTVSAAGQILTVTWTADSCQGVNPALGSAQVQESDTTIDLLVTTPPQISPVALPAGGFCQLSGTKVTTTITLQAPVGDRTVLDDSHLPSRTIQLETGN